jgi:hypothetical protein
MLLSDKVVRRKPKTKYINLWFMNMPQHQYKIHEISLNLGSWHESLVGGLAWRSSLEGLAWGSSLEVWLGGPVCIRGHKLRAYRTQAQTRLWRSRAKVPSLAAHTRHYPVGSASQQNGNLLQK